MKFRDNEDLKPVTVTANSPIELDSKLTQIGKQYDLIDLQFAATCTNQQIGRVCFAALALVRERPLNDAFSKLKTPTKKKGRQ